MSIGSESDQFNQHLYDVIVIGMGAAGVGVSVALKSAGITNTIGVERYEVGASFARWPAEMRMITPSFPTNSIGMLDLNSVAIGVSPAFGLKVEHPTGKQYAAHLKKVVTFFELPVREQVEVLNINKVDDIFHVLTDGETLLAKHVIWAAGEFQYPNLSAFSGSEHCRHIATIPSYRELDGDAFIIIGGYESGVDAAFHLARRGKQVKVFDESFPWKLNSSDPSISLSTYSFERMRTRSFIEHVELFPHTPVEKVVKVDEMYEVYTHDKQVFRSVEKPILAVGFTGSHKLVEHLFEKRDDGFPLLNEKDESTLCPGLFLCGPTVRHDQLIFCFLYKYRQRFAVVAKALATSLGLPAEQLETYRNWGMYLDDLSCCGEECVC